MDIPLNRLDRGYQKYQEEYREAALTILASGTYVCGPALERFEREFSARIGMKYCVGVNSGLDALSLTFRALEIGVGDQVIVPANTFIASILAIMETGATPVLTEPDEYYNLDPARLQERINGHTRAILAVHLYGQGAAMKEIRAIARRHGLYLIEDCAQSHGACVRGIPTGAWGDAGCFSFYPTKGLGAFGDGGAIVCQDPELYRCLKKLRNYGSSRKYHHDLTGQNSRLDELQAALLSVKLRHMDQLIGERSRLAVRYLKEIQNPQVSLPRLRPGSQSVWHLFVVRVKNRTRFMAHLDLLGIHAGIHYPIPPHLSGACRSLGYRRGDFPITEDMSAQVVSLPLFDAMTGAEASRVIEAVNTFR